MNSTNSNTHPYRRLILILMTIVVITGIWFMFLRTSNMGTSYAADILIGEWQRSDGVYKIEIIEVMDDGKMTASYFNPNPIHIGRSGWRVKKEQLQIYIKLQDENYPGSLYELSYDEKKGRLTGTYYQAVTKQTFDVEFSKQ